MLAHPGQGGEAVVRGWEQIQSDRLRLWAYHRFLGDRLRAADKPASQMHRGRGVQIPYARRDPEVHVVLKQELWEKYAVQCDSRLTCSTCGRTSATGASRMPQ